jgi:hypothetical protein
MTVVDTSIVADPWDTTAWHILADQCEDTGNDDSASKCRQVARLIGEALLLPVGGAATEAERDAAVQLIPRDRQRVFAALCSLTPLDDGRRVRDLQTDARSMRSLSVALCHWCGLATDKERTAARAAAWNAARAAARAAARGWQIGLAQLIYEH